MIIDKTYDMLVQTIDDVRKLIDGKLDKIVKINGKSFTEAYLTLRKRDIGLSNVDNTSDMHKPVSYAQKLMFDTKVDKTVRINGYALGNGDIHLPDPLHGRLDQVDNTRDLDKPVSNAQQVILDLKVDKTICINGKPLTSNINLCKKDLCLDQVDNTCDLDKPVSYATRIALNHINMTIASFTSSFTSLVSALNAYVLKSRTINGHSLNSDIVLSRSDIADLSQVDNTSDVDKPISNAQQLVNSQKLNMTSFVCSIYVYL
jgi:hypothetical protein